MTNKEWMEIANAKIGLLRSRKADYGKAAIWYKNYFLGSVDDTGDETENIFNWLMDEHDPAMYKLEDFDLKDYDVSIHFFSNVKTRDLDNFRLRPSDSWCFEFRRKNK